MKEEANHFSKKKEEANQHRTIEANEFHTVSKLTSVELLKQHTVSKFKQRPIEF